ncbi:MAG: hypothetical protein KA004_14790 [Verrucomicrobiales bacterium]|nr:hypothetical protein [Verrucomicrobiales bacterium]
MEFVVFIENLVKLDNDTPPNALLEASTIAQTGELRLGNDSCRRLLIVEHLAQRTSPNF